MTASCRKLVSLVPPNGLHQDVARKIKLSGKSLSALKSLKNKIPRIVLLAFRQAFCYPNINLHFAFLSEHRFLERLSSTVRLIEGKGKRRLGDLNSFFSEIGHRKERLQINAHGGARRETFVSFRAGRFSHLLFTQGKERENREHSKAVT